MYHLNHMLRIILFRRKNMFRFQDIQVLVISTIFSIWVFFHEHSRITGLQEKGKSISLTLHFHFHPLHRHLDISRPITAESSLLHIASSQTRTGKRNSLTTKLRVTPNHPMIYQNCDVMRSISTLDRVHFWIYLLKLLKSSDLANWYIEARTIISRNFF